MTGNIEELNTHSPVDDTVRVRRDHVLMLMTAGMDFRRRSGGGKKGEEEQIKRRQTDMRRKDVLQKKRRNSVR